MKLIVSVLIACLLIAGCHPTVYLKPSEPKSDEISAKQMSADTLQFDSISYDVSAQTIYPYIDPVDEIMIIQNQDDSNSPGIPTPPDGNEPNTAQPPVQEPQTEPSDSIQINMTASMTFEPGFVNVNIGQPVIWRNASEMVHTVTSDPALAKSSDNVGMPGGAQPFDSGDIAPAKTYIMTFSIPGTYKYFCKYHELNGMTGQITVMPLIQ